MVQGPFRPVARDSAPGSTQRPAGAAPLRIVAALGRDTETIARELAPLRAHLERELRLDVAIDGVRQGSAAAEALVRGDVDVAVLPALSCVQVEEWARARLIAIQSYEAAYGADAVLVVRAETRLASAALLRGRRLCSADPSSSTEHLTARSWLRSQGLDPREVFSAERASPDQRQALSDLAAGLCDVAAASETEARRAIARTNGLQILARTGHVPGPCWAASPHLDERTVHSLGLALERFEPPRDARVRWLGDELRIGGFRPADGSTYRAVRLAARLEGLLVRPQAPQGQSVLPSLAPSQPR
jgi:ABC-type phosphate/phosphonate transport system substrate-binding protein